MFDYLEYFKNWFKIKISLWEKDSTRIVFKQGDIWWCSIGMNIGEEIFGKSEKFTRPVLIYKKFTGNSFLGLPLTTRDKEGTWYIKISLHEKISRVMLSQARIFDKKRLVSKMGSLDDTDMKKVKEGFKKLYV